VNDPRVSIVIPARNEESYIGKCLDSILLQDYPATLLEVFVCDGKSTDQTAERVKDYASRHPGIHLLVNEQQTTSFGLNKGIRASTGDFVIILGAHAELATDYVKQCLAAYSYSDKVGCTGGILENIYENDQAEIIGLAMSSGFGVGNAHFRTGSKEGVVDTVAFGAYARKVFEKAGYFDEELVRCQDDEYNFRVVKAGFDIVLSRNIKCRYYVRASFQKLYRQYYQYGYWKVYVNKKHQTITTSRQLVPLFFVLYLIGILPVYLLLPGLGILYLQGAVLYLAVSLGTAFRISRRFKQVMPVVLSFFILHFSYGYGYLKGIIHFLFLGRKVQLDEKLSR